MKYSKIVSAAVAALMPLSVNAEEIETLGKAIGAEIAPIFSSITASGETFNLEDEQDTIVVLEWTNKDCPFVKKHYSTDNMQTLQKAAAENDVTWVTIISSAKGKQGHLTSEAALAHAKEVGATPAHIIHDETGVIGKMYHARTTPTMVVIDKKGHIAYQGAIDSNSSADPADVAGATNYVTAALASLEAGTRVMTPKTQSYGCGVKYAY